MWCRKNGYFPHPDPKVCDVFHFCVEGVANPVNCPRQDNHKLERLAKAKYKITDSWLNNMNKYGWFIKHDSQLLK